MLPSVTHVRTREACSNACLFLVFVLHHTAVYHNGSTKILLRNNNKVVRTMTIQYDPSRGNLLVVPCAFHFVDCSAFL